MYIRKISAKLNFQLAHLSICVTQTNLKFSCLSFAIIIGEDLVQREDDHPETVSKRLENYQLQTTPLLEYYANINLLTTFTGTQSDVIWPEVNKFIRDNLNHQCGDQ